uniref:serine-rich coiled-coil domain-containing protein 2-like n=1 Tax=Centroberyx gerrardi TaxID=166262 RepID=UPI003AAF072A
DILNNLDSCDLEDDDLMLDADFAEDASLHSDGDGMSHMAQWRRRQLCWGTQDVHNDNSDFQCYRLAEDPGNKRSDPITDKPLIFSLSPARSPCLSPGPGLGLDVEELAEDCSAVKSQLEYLQRLLLQVRESPVM